MAEDTEQWRYQGALHIGWEGMCPHQLKTQTCEMKNKCKCTDERKVVTCNLRLFCLSFEF